MGAPNESQSDTLKAVRAMQDADRAGARRPTPGSPGWTNARTVQMNVAGDELLFEIIRAESGSVEQVVDVLPSGGLRIRARCGEHAPASEEGVPEWVAPGMMCVRWEHHEPPHRVTRRGSAGPFFEWQDVDAMGADYLAVRARERRDEYRRQLDGLVEAYAPLRERWRRWYVVGDAERRDSAPEHPASERAAPDLVSRMTEARDVLRAAAGGLRWLAEGITEGEEWIRRVAAARELVAGEPHVCSCEYGSDCAGCSKDFDDVCRFEAALRGLVGDG